MPLPTSSARATPLPVPRQNGVIGGAHRAITFSTGQRCSVKREWDLIWPTSAKPLRPRKKPCQHNPVQGLRLRLLPHRPHPMPRLRPQTLARSKTPNRPRNPHLRLQLLRRPPQTPRLRPRTSPRNQAPSLPHNKPLRQRLLRRRPPSMPQLRPRTPRANKTPSLLRNRLIHLQQRHRLRKPPLLLRPLRHLRNPRCPIPLRGTTNISMRPAV